MVSQGHSLFYCDCMLVFIPPPQSPAFRPYQVFFQMPHASPAGGNRMCSAVQLSGHQGSLDCNKPSIFKLTVRKQVNKKSIDFCWPWLIQESVRTGNETDWKYSFFLVHKRKNITELVATPHPMWKPSGEHREGK